MADSLTLLERLENVQTTGAYTYRARCPSHEGRSRSLSIKLVDDRLLIHCFAGCSPNAIVTATGLTMADLFAKAQHSTPVERRDRIRVRNAREILESISVPIRAVMIGVQIQGKRPMTPGEMESFHRASATINQAFDTAISQGVINVN